MANRNDVYLQILHFGLIAIRDAAHSGKSKYCEIEADHLHNIPSLIDEQNENRHDYYFGAERNLYAERLAQLAESELPGEAHKFALQRYKDLWAELQKIRDEKSQ